MSSNAHLLLQHMCYSSSYCAVWTKARSSKSKLCQCDKYELDTHLLELALTTRSIRKVATAFGSIFGVSQYGQQYCTQTQVAGAFDRLF